ncbi:MAG: TIGR03032 family protein [Pirellulales bacterium]
MSDSHDEKQEVRIDCTTVGEFADWLSRAGGSLAISTYQAGKVALVGWDGQQTSVMMRDFQKPLGMAVSGERLALATRHHLWMFANATLLAPDYIEDQHGRYDSLYLPRVKYLTGDNHIHDLTYVGQQLMCVNTRFSCLAGLSKDFSFIPLWKPSFVSDIVPEDRCHLNSLATRDGQPRYVTALGETDTAGGWREHKADGGVLIDIPSGQTICRGLSMPHSVRWYNNQLWVLNSGMGDLCLVDPDSGALQTVCRLPGYTRGLCFVGPYALVGLSRVRETNIFGGLPIQEKRDSLRCGVAIVDLRTGKSPGMFEFTAGCQELYDVQFLPGKQRPMILNEENEATREAFTNPESSYWLRPSNEVKDSSEVKDNDEGEANESGDGATNVENGHVTAATTTAGKTNTGESNADVAVERSAKDAAQRRQSVDAAPPAAAEPAEMASSKR